jgi:small subunit ribosomal protein S6
LRQYETIFVLDAGLEGPAIDTQVDDVVKLIEGQGFETHEVQRWGRRRLAYPIKKKTDGVYTYIRHDATGELLKEMTRRFQLNEALLRHMTVLYDERLATQAIRREAREAERAAAYEARRESRPPEPRVEEERVAVVETAAPAEAEVATAETKSDGSTGEASE